MRRGSRLLTSRSSSDSHFERHRRRVAVHPEVERFLVEAGLALHQVPVGPTGPPLREALDDAVEGFGEGEQRVAFWAAPCSTATATPRTRRGSSWAQISSLSRNRAASPSGRIPRSMVSRAIRSDYAVALVHLREQVGVGDESASSVALIPQFARLSGLATRSHLRRRQLKAGQQSEQLAAWLLVRRPAFAGLLRAPCVLLLLARSGGLRGSPAHIPRRFRPC